MMAFSMYYLVMNEFDGLSTYQLQQIAFRVTPRHELDDWTATSAHSGWYQMTEEGQRADVIEQLQHFGITRSAINWMRS
jgi:hypothetical protein